MKKLNTILALAFCVTNAAAVDTSKVYVTDYTPRSVIHTTGTIHYVPMTSSVDLSRAQAFTDASNNTAAASARIQAAQNAQPVVYAARQQAPQLTPAQVQGINNSNLMAYYNSQQYSGYASLPIDPVTGIPQYVGNQIVQQIIATQVLK